MRQFLTILFVAFLFVGAFSLQSCNKCAVCQYTYTGVDGEQKTFSYAEVCGNNNDVDDYKSLCVEAAAQKLNGNCTCVDE